MIWFVYNLVFPVLLAVMLPYYLLRMARRGGYRQGFLQRLGRYAPDVKDRLAAPRRIWMHAVSVGEMYVALRFIEGWRQAHPDAAFVVTTNTSTAHRLAERTMNPADVLLYFPVDLPPVVRSVLDRIQPVRVIMTEGELWPNLLREVHRRGIPLALINGRVSDRSFPRYRRLRALFGPVLNRFDTICAQGRQDAERFLAIGADPVRVVVTGSAKYDVALQAPGDPVRGRDMLARAGIPESALVLVGGSTWAGEEDLLLDHYRRCKAAHPGLVLVLVPRHAERREAVLAAIRARGLSVVQRSATGDQPAPVAAPDVLLVDTTGELRHVYTVGDLVFVGKSLTQHGGQNVIEPAACGKAIVVGPHMENFPDVMRDLRAADAIVQVADAMQFDIAIERLLGDPDSRRAYGNRARAVADAGRGGIRRMVEAIDGGRGSRNDRNAL